MSDVKDVPFGDKMRSHLTEREIALTGKRFCATCQCLRPAEGGEKRRFVWRCQICVDRAKKRQQTNTLKSTKPVGYYNWRDDR